MLENQQIEQKVTQIISDLFEVAPERINAESKLFEELGLDSLDAIDLVVEFQKEFGIKPSNDELKEIRSAGDVFALVQKYANSNSKPS